VTDNSIVIKYDTEIDSRGGIVFPAMVRKGLGADKGETITVELKEGILSIKRSTQNQTKN
jgi:bifunctional DNA-binding transcriptional regulator/antitoxin component of YhaV-PrlF toxin-antitoxin module